MCSPRIVKALHAGLLAVVISLLWQLLAPVPSHAEFFPGCDWKDHKHKLKVCIQDVYSLCPPGIADSVAKAVALWDSARTTWQFSVVSDCSEADIIVACREQSDLGMTRIGPNNPNNTRAEVLIKTNGSWGSWGWCDDKPELVSTLVHELGHCTKLKDTDPADQTKAMRSVQKYPGHLRGPSSADSAEASESDTARIQTTVNTPGNELKQTSFSCTMTPAPGTWPFNLERATSFNIIPFAPSVLHVLGVSPVNSNTLNWVGQSTGNGASMEVLFLVIQYPESLSVRQSLLYITNVAWQPTWAPHAVAPPDTTVPNDTSRVILYPFHSYHTGNQYMSFAWSIDDTSGAEGDDGEVEVRLPAGIHRAVLIATDNAGRVSQDTTMVTVLASTSVSGAPPVTLKLGFPVPYRMNRSITITYQLARPGHLKLQVLDMQGRLMRTLASEEASAGSHTLQWNLRDDSGRRVASGVYLCLLRSGGSTLLRKMILLN